MIPYPLIYGALVDSSCSIWEMTCSISGHCWVYNTDAFRVRLHVVTSGLFLAAAMFNGFTCYYSKDVKNMYGESKKPNWPNYSNNAMNEVGTSNIAFEMNSHESESMQ